MRNFKRIKSALLSRKKSAYYGFWNLAISPFGRALCKFFKRPDGSLNITPIFILSLPRSGSTLVYQSLVSYIPSVYISNLHNTFPGTATRSLKKRSKLGNNLLKYRNYYGYAYGENGVNEGNHFLDKIFQIENEAERKEAFLSFLKNMDLGDHEVFIFKNIKHSQNLSSLKKWMPNLKVVYLERDNEMVAQSIFKAYLELGYFNPIPKELESIEFTEDPHRFTARQIKSLKKEIEAELLSFASNDIYKLKYEDFCKDPKQYCNEILQRFELDLTLRNIHINLSASQKITINQEDYKKLQSNLQTIE
ncbi:MAG: sulfotransferase [Bacteroidota bacterium]